MSSLEADRRPSTNIHAPSFLSNLIDKDVQLILRPLNLMHLLVLNPKYYIKNNFIHPNNRFNKLISVCGAVLYVFTLLYRNCGVLLDENFRRYSVINYLYFASIFSSVFSCGGFVMNSIINTVQTQENVNFVLSFQEVHRYLNDEKNLKRSIIISWIHPVTIFTFYFTLISYMLTFEIKPQIITIFNLLALTTIDTNVIYAIRLIQLLTDKVKLWNERVLLLAKEDCNEMEWKKMLQIFMEISKCYNTYKAVFQTPVLYHTLGAFSNILIDFQAMIEICVLYYNYQKTPFASVVVDIWMFKCLVVQIVLSLYVDQFYEAVKNAQDSCLFVCVSDCTDQKKLCKNVLRMHRATFSKMTACFLFYIDVCHPLRLMARIMKYAIVLLQFAFL